MAIDNDAHFAAQPRRMPAMVFLAHQFPRPPQVSRDESMPLERFAAPPFPHDLSISAAPAFLTEGPSGRRLPSACARASACGASRTINPAEDMEQFAGGENKSCPRPVPRSNLLPSVFSR